MTQIMVKQIVCAFILLVVSISATAVSDERLRRFIGSDTRTEVYAARDVYRHPQATLEFFQVRATDTVVEIWPGGGWYAEILGPWLNAEGSYYAAHFSPAMEKAFFLNSRERFQKKLVSASNLYGNAKLTSFYPPSGRPSAPAGSADKVLTFRNVHNWLKAGYAESAFQEFYIVLKPGGILGVVEHRAKPGTSLEDMNTSGYVTEAKVKQLAEQAGLEFVASSEINANPKDTTDHPRGVWTLPPSLRLGDENRDYYLSIGESDRMTLMFRKPEPSN